MWRWLRYVVGLGLAALAIYLVTGKTDELRGASTFLSGLRWWWVIPAAALEAASYLSFAGLQRRLLLAGEVAVPVAPMAGITMAANAIQNSLPAGVLLSAAYSFRQYRRHGADDVLSGWVVVAMAAVSLITLSGLAAAGLALAASTGSALDLVESIVGVVAIAAVAVLGWSKRQYLMARAEGLVRLSQRFFHRPAGDAHQVIREAYTRLSRVAPSKREWTVAGAYGLGNWVLDLGCLTVSFLAVGADVPWQGLLLAYTAAQLATNLPITPGGLGVVEGSLTVALVAFGGGQVTTVAAVLLYRLMNYWAMLPIGWGAWGVLALQARRHPELVPGAPLAPLAPEQVEEVET